MESKQTYYILHILYTNSEFSIVLPYIRSHLNRLLRFNHCATLVHQLPTLMLVRAAVRLLTFCTSMIFAIIDLRISNVADSTFLSVYFYG